MRANESSDEVAQPISLIQSMGQGFYTNGGVEPKRVVENTSQSVLYLCEKLEKNANKMVKTLDDNLSFWEELGIKDRQNVDGPVRSAVIEMLANRDKNTKNASEVDGPDHVGDQRVKYCKKGGEFEENDVNMQTQKNESVYMVHEGDKQNGDPKNQQENEGRESNLDPQIISEGEDDPTEPEIDYKDAHASILSKGVLGNWGNSNDPSINKNGRRE